MAFKPIYMSNILPFFQSTFCSLGVDMSWFCSVCEKSFSRKDSVQRHVISKQRNVGLTSFQTVQCLHKNVSVSLRTSFCLHDCWNDWVRENGLGSISITNFRGNLPSPKRIVWCYSQWQPAYIEMLVAMPHIEFVKVIPTALEQDSYFDVNKRNLIVFDYQMIDASKDK